MNQDKIAENVVRELTAGSWTGSGYNDMEKAEENFSKVAVVLADSCKKVIEESKDLADDFKTYGDSEGVRAASNLAKKTYDGMGKALRLISEMRGNSFTAISLINRLSDLIEERPDGDRGVYKHGFDLTEMDADKWVRALKSVGVSPKPRLTSGEWQWKGPGILVVTANDPISGEYSRGNRGSQKDYLSYVGIEGDADKVMKLVKAIKSGASFIKGESAGNRDYI